MDTTELYVDTTASYVDTTYYLDLLADCEWLSVVNWRVRYDYDIEGRLITLASMGSLSDNQLSGPIPVALGNLSLVELTLDNNQLNGPIPAELGNLSYLEELTLDNNQLSGCVPSQLRELTDISTGEIIDITTDNLNDLPFCQDG